MVAGYLGSGLIQIADGHQPAELLPGPTFEVEPRHVAATDQTAAQWRHWILVARLGVVPAKRYTIER